MKNQIKIIFIILCLLLSLLFTLNTAFAQMKPPPSPFSFNGELVRSNLPPALNNKQPVLIVQSSGESMALNNNTTNTINTNNNPEKIVSSNNIADKIVNVFESKFSDYASRLIPFVLRLLYAVAIFAVVFNAIMHLIRGSDMRLFIVDAGTILVIMSIYQFIIKNWIDISAYLIEYFRTIGTKVADHDLTYAGVLDAMVTYLSAIFNALTALEIGKSIAYIFFGFTTMMIVYKIVSIYMYTFFETIIISKLSIIYLGFGSFSGTEGFAKKPFKYCVAAGIKMMFLHLFFGAIMTLILDFKDRPITIENVSIMLFIVIIIHHIVSNLTCLVDSFIHQAPGTPQRSALAESVKAGVMDSFKAIQAARNVQKAAAAALAAAKKRTQAQLMNPPQFSYAGANIGGSSNGSSSGQSSSSSSPGVSSAGTKSANAYTSTAQSKDAGKSGTQNNATSSSANKGYQGSATASNLQKDQPNVANAPSSMGKPGATSQAMGVSVPANQAQNSAKNGQLERGTASSNTSTTSKNSHGYGQNSPITPHDDTNKSQDGSKQDHAPASKKSAMRQGAEIAMHAAANFASAATKGNLSPAHMRDAAENKLQRENFAHQQKSMDASMQQMKQEVFAMASNANPSEAKPSEAKPSEQSKKDEQQNMYDDYVDSMQNSSDKNMIQPIETKEEIKNV